METTKTAHTPLVTAHEIEFKRWRPFGEILGVSTKTLWHDSFGGSYAGVLRLAAGAKIPAHSHRLATHHLWVLEGECEIADRLLTAGSYAFAPLGVEHGILAVGERGCTMFYLYLLAADID